MHTEVLSVPLLGSKTRISMHTKTNVLTVEIASGALIRDQDLKFTYMSLNFTISP